MKPYEHTQTARWLFVLMLPVIGFAIVARTEPGAQAAAVFAIAVAAVVLIVFTRLAIGVDAEGVRWSMGYGWPAGFIPAAEITRAEITRTNLLEGWGIHWTIWHGWLWNVGGFQAVEICKTDGSSVTLGTDDPQGLLDAIERFRRGAA